MKQTDIELPQECPHCGASLLLRASVAPSGGRPGRGFAVQVGDGSFRLAEDPGPGWDGCSDLECTTCGGPLGPVR